MLPFLALTTPTLVSALGMTSLLAVPWTMVFTSILSGAFTVTMVVNVVSAMVTINSMISLQ